MKDFDTDKLRRSAEKITLTPEQKQRIVENCQSHAGKSPDTGQIFESEHIFQVERVQPHPVRRVLAGIAACAVLAGGIGLSTHFISRSGLPDAPASEVSDEAVTPFGDFTRMDFVQIPDIVGEKAEDAVVLLEYKGLKYRIVYIAGEDKDTVASMDHNAGGTYPAGTEVTLYVMNGSTEPIDYGYPFPGFTDYSYVESIHSGDFITPEQSTQLDEYFRTVDWQEIDCPNDDPGALVFSFWHQDLTFGDTIIYVTAQDCGYVKVISGGEQHAYTVDFENFVQRVGDILTGGGVTGNNAPFAFYSQEESWEIGFASEKSAAEMMMAGSSNTALRDLLRNTYWQTYTEEAYKAPVYPVGFGSYHLSYFTGEGALKLPESGEKPLEYGTGDATNYDLYIYDDNTAEYIISDGEGNTLRDDKYIINSAVMESIVTQNNSFYSPVPPFGMFHKYGTLTANGADISDHDISNKLDQLFYGYDWKMYYGEGLPREAPEFEFTAQHDDTVMHVLVYSDDTVAWFDYSGDNWTADTVDAAVSGNMYGLCDKIRELIG